MIDKDKLFTLLIGRCYHEGNGETWQHCRICNQFYGPHINHVPPTFDEIRLFMEITWPDLWEKYLKKVFNTVPAWNTSGGLPYTEAVREQRNLDNFFAFMVENKEAIGRDHPAIKYLEETKLS